ncbi:unnamed protein product [Prunus brigantina]
MAVGIWDGKNGGKMKEEVFLPVDVKSHIIELEYEQNTSLQMYIQSFLFNLKRYILAPRTQPGVFILMASATICSSSSSTMKPKLAPTISWN